MKLMRTPCIPPPTLSVFDKLSTQPDVILMCLSFFLFCSLANRMFAFYIVSLSVLFLIVPLDFCFQLLWQYRCVCCSTSLLLYSQINHAENLKKKYKTKKNRTNLKKQDIKHGYVNQEKTTTRKTNAEG